MEKCRSFSGPIREPKLPKILREEFSVYLRNADVEIVSEQETTPIYEQLMIPRGFGLCGCQCRLQLVDLAAREMSYSQISPTCQ
jgi:hypothetical protein